MKYEVELLCPFPSCTLPHFCCFVGGALLLHLTRVNTCKEQICGVKLLQVSNVTLRYKCTFEMRKKHIIPNEMVIILVVSAVVGICRWH